jgi:hypothetical protein
MLRLVGRKLSCVADVVRAYACSRLPGGLEGEQRGFLVSAQQFRIRAPIRAVAIRMLSVVTVVALVAVSGAQTAPAASQSQSANIDSRHSARLLDAEPDSDSALIARDVSFPQCGGPLPALDNGYAGVLGTNNGISFSRNPCLVSELAWAKRLAGPPAFYANTGNPGPALASSWPVGQSGPETCSPTNPDSLGCAYDYGWNAAWASYSVAVDAAQRLHHVDRANARARAANVAWWLDVETMNSWRTLDNPTSVFGAQSDTATIAGEVDALRTIGVEQVGIYSTPFQWNQITGGYPVTQGRFAAVPVWLAGYGSKADAIAGCGDASFTGGSVQMTQYLGSDGFDADVVCGTQSG